MEELYDHSRDPEELRNLADHPEYKDLLLEMRMLFKQARKKAGADLQP